MTFEELLEKYQTVLLENGILKEEIKRLYTKLGVSEHRAIPYGVVWEYQSFEFW